MFDRIHSYLIIFRLLIGYESGWDHHGCQDGCHWSINSTSLGKYKQAQLQKGEFITKVSGTFSDVIVSLGIETNMGQNISEYGPGFPENFALQSFSFRGHRLMYISGRSGSVIYALKFHFDVCNRMHPAMFKPWTITVGAPIIRISALQSAVLSWE